MDISNIDKNFAVQTEINRDGLVFINVIDRSEFSIHGVFYENGLFRRIPEEVANNTNDGVMHLHKDSAGGRIRFRTNSPYIAVHLTFEHVYKGPHYAFTGSIGLDLYRDGEYIGTYWPKMDTEADLEGVLDIRYDGEAEYTINMPLYSAVTSMYVGLKEGSTLSAPTPYAITLPVVYYGSSITQGGCASRPGNAYQTIIAREINADFVNLGFSGSARGEKAISDYIASLNMSAFVLDYDHNAPTLEHLKATHKPLYENVRKHHPDLPILFITRPKSHLTPEELQRLEVVRSTYNEAIENGDKNVYFLPGNEIFDKEHAECALVDNCHPNDCGFVQMAYRILPILKDMLKI